MKKFLSNFFFRFVLLKVQWVVNNINGDACLIAEMNIKANFSYNATGNKFSYLTVTQKAKSI